MELIILLSLKKINCDYYSDNYIRIKVKCYDDLSLEKTLKIHEAVVLVRSSFIGSNKC